MDMKILHSKEISIWTYTIYHPVGTCKMGNIDKDNNAVVDCKLKVKGYMRMKLFVFCLI